MSGSFSEHNPDLQLAWDSTSLAAYQKCPRYYQYTILERYQADSVHLEFGKVRATAFEVFFKARLNGLDREAATIVALRRALLDTWIDERRQWGGEWKHQWHCLGDQPYKNEKGNRAKCPNAHAHFWREDEQPDVCPECGGTVEGETRYEPGNPTKNRVTLVRNIIAYGFDQPEELDDGLRPYVFPNGANGVELSYKLELPIQTAYGEPYFHTGHIDFMGQLGREVMPVDNKTTYKALNDDYWKLYRPSIQFDNYDMSVSILYPDLNNVGMMIDAEQSLVGSVAFGRHIFYYDETQREENWLTLEYWIKQAEANAMAHYWPMNKVSCGYCAFNEICAMRPSQRQGWLDQIPKRAERWDPMKER